MRAAFVNSLDSSSGEDESNSFFKFWHVNAFFLEIWILPNRPGRVKLGGTGAVGISASHPRTFLIYRANSRHVRSNLHDIMPECNPVRSLGHGFNRI